MESTGNYYLIDGWLNQFSDDTFPSNKNVLSRFLYIHFHDRKTLKESAKATAIEIENIWKTALVPTQIHCRIKSNIKSIHSKWKGLKKNKSRESTKQRRNEETFFHFLQQLFDVSYNHVLKNMSIDDKNRLGLGGPVFKISDKLDERKEFWKRVVESPEENDNDSPSIEINDEENDSLNGLNEDNTGTEEEPANVDESNVGASNEELGGVTQRAIVNSNISDDYESDINSDDSDISYVHPNKKLKMRKKRKILTPNLASALDRTKTSDRFAVHILVNAAYAMELNPANMVINRESFRVGRRENREAYARELLMSFDPDTPLVVHWDGKLLPINRTDKVERIAVCVTGGNIVKLLGVPYIKEESTGKNQFELVYGALIKWGLLDRVAFMCFDTTSLNTGRLKGTCQWLQAKFGDRLLLRLACRHHILEVIAGKVYSVALKDVSTGPNIKLFERFQKFWKHIDVRKYESCLNDERVNVHILPIRDRLIKFVKNQLQELHHRDDYRELLSLVLLFLGERIKNYCFYTCGASHRARWMSKLIYCLKMYLFRSQFNLTSTELNGIQDFNVFIVSIYVENWYQAPSTVRAPKNDLQMLKDLMVYKKINDTIADAAVSKLSRHLWYISETLAGIAFFDSSIAFEEKRAMVAALKNKGARNPPVRPTIDITNIENYTIADFITSNSLAIFKALKLSEDFLKYEPETWLDRDDYKHARKTVKELQVTNDVAERAIALATKFNGLLTHDEDQCQYLLQVVEHQIKNYPNANKATVMKPLRRLL